MMRRVFAEEKASGVRDSMDEYLKRLQKYVWEPEQALEETKRLEKQLSEQLTRLRNSMLKDGQMSSRAMKIWTNGATFHAQMLIHEARLMMAGYGSKKEKNLDLRVASVSNMVDHYRKDLEELLDKYKSYKRTNLHMNRLERAYPFSPDYCYICDIELRMCTERNPTAYRHDLFKFNYCGGSLGAYMNYMFSNWEGNLSENWRRRIQQFHLYLAATEKEGKPEKLQCSLLLQCAGEQAQELYSTFTFANDDVGNIEPTKI
nr:uncharacterized protein LOC111840028 [Paramormyrops kingsleyae]